MTYEELLAKITKHIVKCDCGSPVDCYEDTNTPWEALLTVVNLHSPEGKPDQQCRNCKRFYPCHTIQAIIKELQ